MKKKRDLLTFNFKLRMTFVKMYAIYPHSVEDECGYGSLTVGVQTNTEI